MRTIQASGASPQAIGKHKKAAVESPLEGPDYKDVEFGHLQGQLQAQEASTPVRLASVQWSERGCYAVRRSCQLLTRTDVPNTGHDPSRTACRTDWPPESHYLGSSGRRMDFRGAPDECRYLGTNEYHGYPVRPSEAIAELVYKRFSAWAIAHGNPQDQQAARACKTDTVSSDEKIQHRDAEPESQEDLDLQCVKISAGDTSFTRLIRQGFSEPDGSIRRLLRIPFPVEKLSSAPDQEIRQKLT